MSDTPQPKEGRFWEVLAFGAYFLGLAAIAIYAGQGDGWKVFAVLAVVGTAAWLAGTTLGFLFGVPRVRSSEAPVGARGGLASIVPNTNLEQISDWLTKIIVGATLVQLGPIAEAVGRLSIVVGRGVGTGADAPVISGGVLVFFFAAGFIWGYLWCSLLVFKEMQALVQKDRLGRAGDVSPVAVDA